MKRKFFEWLSIQKTKNPGRMILLLILLFNIVFLAVSSFVISRLSLSGTEHMGIWEAAFSTVTMILDAGCIQFVIADIGTSGVAIALFCLAVVIIGMISFTGAVIGYVTNFISGYIENANSGSSKLSISNHVVILNWNSRGSEIINDLLYCDGKQHVVVLVGGKKEEVSREISERLEDTVAKERKAIFDAASKLGFLARRVYLSKNRFKNNIVFVVREGDVFSSKQLRDISLEYAKTVIILGNDVNNSMCKYEQRERSELIGRGNPQTVKTLMQVADITSADYSFDNQKIIVEVTDDWTDQLIRKIISAKQVEGKCNIVPVRINRVLGQILSQFSLMPELNAVYRELFSNKGATFYPREEAVGDEHKFISEYLASHKHAIPLTEMSYKGRTFCYYSSDSEKDIERESECTESDFAVSLNENYWIVKKNVIILGHNSISHNIMMGFSAFTNEWGTKNGDGILSVVVIDEAKNLEKMDYYRSYPFVSEIIEAEIYDREKICDAISRTISQNEGETSILILSDDSVINEDIDSNALANLVYVQDIINEKCESDPDFERESVDVIVEIIDPKHHDIVHSYSVNNVVISNRYISKMVTQIGEKEAMYDFYTDILTYDSKDVSEYESKEVYSKKVTRFFKELPPACTAEELIRAVYRASCESEGIAPTVVIGYSKPNGETVLFEGNQSKITVELGEHDKIIVFSAH